MKRLTWASFALFAMFSITLLPACKKEKKSDSDSDNTNTNTGSVTNTPSGEPKNSPLVGAGDPKAVTNQVLQLGIGLHAHHDANNAFPTSGTVSPQANPLLSWRVAILPYIEEQALYSQFKFDEPWDSAHNIKLLKSMPKIFEIRGVPSKEGHTYFRGFTNGVLVAGRRSVQQPKSGNFSGGLGFNGISDGTSNTLLLVTCKDATPWTKPDDLNYDGKGPSPLGYFFQGKAIGVMADGRAVRISPNVSAQTLLHAIMPADGNVLGADWPDGK
jgi:hypothetical protein